MGASLLALAKSIYYGIQASAPLSTYAFAFLTAAGGIILIALTG